MLQADTLSINDKFSLFGLSKLRRFWNMAYSYTQESNSKKPGKSGGNFRCVWGISAVVTLSVQQKPLLQRCPRRPTWEVTEKTVSA